MECECSSYIGKCPTCELIDRIEELERKVEYLMEIVEDKESEDGN